MTEEEMEQQFTRSELTKTLVRYLAQHDKGTVVNYAELSQIALKPAAMKVAICFLIDTKSSDEQSPCDRSSSRPVRAMLCVIAPDTK